MYFGTHLQGIFSPGRPFPPLGRCYQPASPCQLTEDPSWHLLPREHCSALYCDAWALAACRNSATRCQGTVIVPNALEASSVLASGLISHGKSEETTMGGFLCKALRKGAPAGPKARGCSAPSARGTGGRSAGPAPPSPCASTCIASSTRHTLWSCFHFAGTKNLLWIGIDPTGGHQHTHPRVQGAGRGPVPGSGRSSPPVLCRRALADSPVPTKSGAGPRQSLAASTRAVGVGPVL